MSPKQALDKLIHSWKTHDIHELSELFSDSFSYDINGKTRFTSKPDLRRYWSTNSSRQIELKIFTQLDEHTSSNSIATYFTALFYHPGRFAVTVVSGRMEIWLDRSGKIEKLAENYEKIENKSALYAIGSAYRVWLQPAVRRVSPFLFHLGKALKGLARYGLLGFFLIGLCTVVYINFLHESTHIFSDGLVEFLKPLVVYYFAALYVINQFLPLLRSKIAPDIEVSKLSSGDDLKIMYRELTGADRVSILSGDFSFISENKKLEDTLRTLAFEGKLELFSYKSQSEVEREIKIKSKAYEIYLRLMDDKKFYFDAQVAAKCTIAEFGNVKKMLFRFSKDGAIRDELHMGVIRRRENSQYLIEIVDRVFSSQRRHIPSSV